MGKVKLPPCVELMYITILSGNLITYKVIAIFLN